MIKSNKVKKILKKIFLNNQNIFKKNYLQYLEKDKKFLNELNKKIASNNIFKIRKFDSIYEFSVYRNFIYNLVRNTKPKTVIETGVLHGLTSAWILKGLKENNYGKLYSIDLPRRSWNKFFKQKFGPGGKAELEIKNEKPGWVIPDDLRKNWKLFLGPSSKFLPLIKKKLRKIDLFIHDSDHSYNIMSYECSNVNKFYGNIDLVIDDYYCNSYYKKHAIKFKRKYYFIDDVNDNNIQVPGCVFFPKK